MAEWAYLPEEILDLIMSKLFDQDRYNFRLVCRSWNVISANSLYPINSPCLIHYNRKKGLWGFFQNDNFFYRSFPDFEDTEILCSKYGWLLMSGSYLFFYNPFCGHTEPFVDLYLSNQDHYMSTHFFHPPTSPDCFIIGISTPINIDGPIVNVDLLRYDDDNWKSITCECEYEFLVSNAAPVLHHGLVYFVGIKGDVATLDIDRGVWTTYRKSLESRKLRNQIRRHYLLKINGDEDTLYAVFMIYEREIIKVFRLLEPEMKWERVTDLGDKRLYLSLASSFGEVAKPKNMANTICFPIVDPDENLVFYSLKTQRYHSFNGNYTFDNEFGLTRLHYGATWITPIPPHQLSSDLVWSEYSEADVKDDDPT